MYQVEQLRRELDECPSHLEVLVRTSDGGRVMLTVAITDVRVEDGRVVLIGDLEQVAE